MNYWINVHWPSLEDDMPETPSPLPDPDFHYLVYLPDGRQQAASGLRPDDLIFIYESKTGRARTDGRKYAEGAFGIIALVRALTPVRIDPNAAPEYYVGGTSILWNWQALTQVRELGFCHHDDVCRIMGYSTNWTLHGFGDLHSGIKKITPDQYRALLNIFRQG